MHKEEIANMNLKSIGYNNSMGFIRYILASAVIIAHFNTIFSTNFFFPVSSYHAVGGFFALSGFLIFGSYLKRQNLKSYLISRAKRIFPAYFFIVIVCAFGFAWISDLTPKAYFTTEEFWKYLISNLCFLNFLQPDLPGVFESSVIPAVNGSLWTMKVEISMYISVPIIVAFLLWLQKKKIRYNLNLIIVIIYLFSMIYRIGFHILSEIYDKEIYVILGRQFLGQLMFFYSGVLIYMNFELFSKYKYQTLILCLIFMYCGKWIPYYDLTIGPFIISLFTLSVCFFKGIVRWFNYNNISYEMYLFHFPVIQLAFHFFSTENPALMFIYAYLAILLLSTFSWFVIDKRFLSKNFV